MRTENQVIRSTAGRVSAELEHLGLDPARPVTIMVGNPSLSMIARRLQSEAALRGMTQDNHDRLMDEVKHDH